MVSYKSPHYLRQPQAQAPSSSQLESSSSSPLPSSSSSPSLTIPSSSTALAPSSSSSDSIALTSSASASTSNAVSSSTSIFSPTSNGVTPSSTATSSSAIPISSSTPTSATTAARLSSPSSTPDPPLLSLTPSSGFSFSTFTTSFVTDIGGSPTTIVTPTVTALRTSAPSRASARTNVIAGSAVGGLVLFIIGLTTLFVLRRRAQRQRYWALTRKRLPSRATFLAGEDMDLPHPTPAFVYSDQDPFASRSSRTVSATPSYVHSQSSRTQSPSLSITSPPRLFRPRASESGSIFQESVWPPPSQLTDPLTTPSQSVDLTRIVDDVMGPLHTGLHTGPRDMSEMDSLLTVHEDGQEQQQQQGHVREHSLEGSALQPPPLAFTLANPDYRPRSPESIPPSPSPPPPSRWLARSPNPSPKNSPLHKTQAI